jgi:hypothetical protein
MYAMNDLLDDKCKRAKMTLHELIKNNWEKAKINE